MHIAYLDDSRDPTTCIVSALVIPVEEWRATFQAIKGFRSEKKASDGLFTRKEWHATDFVSGRGRIADRVISKTRRSEIFVETLGLIAGMSPSGVRLFNAAFPRALELRAYERTLNRINRTMKEWGTQAILIWDEGKEGEHRRLARKM
ncbi:MAG TPA: hypothetical protein VGR41_08295, partial [Actinomycetota bacterium]|nr:hypothetical protein [Actinomycetota bacterium]